MRKSRQDESVGSGRGQDAWTGEELPCSYCVTWDWELKDGCRLGQRVVQIKPRVSRALEAFKGGLPSSLSHDSRIGVGCVRC